MNSQDLIERFVAAGLHAIEVAPRLAPKRFAPPLPFSCVEGAKRILGIHAWTVVTPWQLYKFLIKGSKNPY